MSVQPEQSAAGSDPASVQLIQRALHNLRYGALEIVVHDGRIVQVERREKIRLETGAPVHSAR